MKKENKKGNIKKKEEKTEMKKGENSENKKETRLISIVSKPIKL